MQTRRSQTWASAVALVAVLAVAWVTLAAALPGHWHKNQPGRSCDVCRSGQLPALQAASRIEVQALAPLEWRTPSRVSEPLLEATFDLHASRAPPA